MGCERHQARNNGSMSVQESSNIVLKMDDLHTSRLSRGGIKNFFLQMEGPTPSVDILWRPHRARTESWPHIPCAGSMDLCHGSIRINFTISIPFTNHLQSLHQPMRHRPQQWLPQVGDGTQLTNPISRLTSLMMKRRVYHQMNSRNKSKNLFQRPRDGPISRRPRETPWNRGKRFSLLLKHSWKPSKTSAYHGSAPLALVSCPKTIRCLLRTMMLQMGPVETLSSPYSTN